MVSIGGIVKCANLHGKGLRLFFKSALEIPVLDP